MSEVLSQQTYVPDDNFEAYLESNGMGNGIPFDDSVTTANINSVSSVYLDNEGISDLTGIEGFSSLTFLVCINNNLTSLDLSSNQLLNHLSCHSNNLSSLNVSSNSNLSVLYCALNQLTTLDLSQNFNLTQFDCSFNNITQLDLSQNNNLVSLGCRDNELTCLNIKNGQNVSNNLELIAINNPNLTCIQVDDTNWSTNNWTTLNGSIDATMSFSLDCQNNCSLGIKKLGIEEKELLKIVDLMGREVPYEKNKVLIYVYSDGTTERVFEFE